MTAALRAFQLHASTCFSSRAKVNPNFSAHQAVLEVAVIGRDQTLTEKLPVTDELMHGELTTC